METLNGLNLFVVRGKVCQADGNPLVGIKIRAFDKGLRKEKDKPLDEAVTDASGKYQIKYAAESVDLIVKAYSPEDEELATSSVKYRAQQEEIIDLQISLDMYRGTSEFERLSRDLEPHLAEIEVKGVPKPTIAQKLSDLKKDEIFALIGKSGKESQTIERIASASKLHVTVLSQGYDLPVEIFYALACKGLPTDLPSLVAVSPLTLNKALEDAITENIISIQFKGEVDKIVNKLKNLNVEQPVFLLKPEVLFSNLVDLKHLSLEQAGFITERLNDQFHKELLRAMGTVSPDMSLIIGPIVTELDYRDYIDTDLNAIIKNDIIAKVKQEADHEGEAAELETHLANGPSSTVDKLLRLDIPLSSNPAFSEDLYRAKAHQYAQFANLDVATTLRLVEKSRIIINANLNMLDDLVKEGVITSQQKMDLHPILEMARLTGDNLPLLTLLKNKGVKSIADLTCWGQEDWHKAIADANLPLPPGETIESYVDIIFFNVERAYPSHVLLNRVLRSDKTKKFEVLNSLNDLLLRNDRLIDGTNPATIDWTGVNDAEKEIKQLNLQDLTHLANTYRHLGFVELINDKNMKLEEKTASITSKLQWLDTFQKNNPDFDLRAANFLNTRENGLNWNDIPESGRPLVKKQFMAYQRVLDLADTTSDREQLLSRGYDSSTSIARQTEMEFISNSGLSRGKARKTLNIAQEKSVSIAHTFMDINDVVRGPFKQIPVDPKLINDLREIDGFSDIFGSQDYCDCEDCRSILSPAAYFVDLMYFIESKISRIVFGNNPDHPLYLKKRRGDLWNLKLTCENTNRPIPYLTIVNEVLDNYISSASPVDTFQRLSNAAEKISFGLPFNLPLEELRLFLSHFELTLHDVYRSFRQPDDLEYLKARLNISKDEFELITKPDFDGIPLRMGLPSLPNELPVNNHKDPNTHEVQRGFINCFQISRSQLDELLAIQIYPDLANLKITNDKNIPDEIQNFPEFIQNLTPNRLDFIHRFLRLWLKTPWSISELDLILTALKEAKLIEPIKNGNTLNDKAVIDMIQLFDIGEKLHLAVDELCSLVYQLPVSNKFPLPPAKQTDQRLYERLFDLKKLFGEKDPRTHELNESIKFSYPQGSSVDPRTPLLLAGLGISEEELKQLFELLKDNLGLTPFLHGQQLLFVLDREKISLIYRYACLARSLKFSIDDFIKVLQIIGHVDQIINTPSQISDLWYFKDWLKSSPLNIDEIQFILWGKEGDSLKYASTSDQAAALVKEVQASQKSDKMEALYPGLAHFFNLTSTESKTILMWINGKVLLVKISAILAKTGTLSPEDQNQILDLLKQIERVMLMFSKLKFGEETVTWIAKHPKALGTSDFEDINLNNLKAMVTYQKLNSPRDDADPTTRNLLDDYLNFNSKEGIDRLTDFFKQNRSLIESLVGTLQLPPLPIDGLDHISKALTLCLSLGINGYSLQKLIDDSDYDKLSAARDIALGAFSSKYPDEKDRQEKLGPYQDQMNLKKRDAMCDFIIAKEKTLKFKDLSDIYAFFLIDVEMSSCFRTSRVLSAISSLQLYVHRCLMNLEQSASQPEIQVNPVLITAEEWNWRKNYRVWEANRKVFLYSENYIEPDLRDNKSPIFKELEDELLQQKITKEAAEDAYKKYMSQFAELSRLRITGAFFYPETNTYYFFARTQQEPAQYYYRRWINCDAWTPWEKIELTINASFVSSAINHERLYLFWTDVKLKETTDIKEGNSIRGGYDYTVDLVYSYLNEYGKWIPSQKVTGLSYGSLGSQYPEPYLPLYRNRVYPIVNRDIVLLYRVEWFNYPPFCMKLDLFNNWLRKYDENHLGDPIGKNGIFLALNPEFSGISKPNAALWYVSFHPVIPFREPALENMLELDKLELDTWVDEASFIFVSDSFPYSPYYGEGDLGRDYHMQLVQGNNKVESIFTFENNQYLIRSLNMGVYADVLDEFEMVNLSTSLADNLGQILFSQRLEQFLSLQTQKANIENSLKINITKLWLLNPPHNNADHIDFDRSYAYGEYYWELFFHVPSLIANHLNANQKFEEAKWWYERIFNPTASETPIPPKETDRNWQFIEFRGRGIETMRQILTDKGAIDQYKNDSFNPHAIARLRLNAYPKGIVMKYIDNLIDWGDYLFAQDSVESINEATMLYVLASDILGSRPVKMGKCETADDNSLTFNKIGPEIDKGSEFLIMVENWNSYSAQTVAQNKVKAAISANVMTSKSLGERNMTSGVEAVSSEINNASFSPADFKPKYSVSSYAGIKEVKNNWSKELEDWDTTKPIGFYPGITIAEHSALAFCIPPNDDFFGYWDRVEDRLFKIRHCMNISGIRQQLALFQPPINPMLLVRAKAAGLSLEEILAGGGAPLPPYRFTYLIEKARQFTQTLQSFGNALLSALEKKDVEELTLLRSVHERDILGMTKGIKEQQIKEAQYQCQALGETKTNVQNRIDYYQGLIDEGLILWENTQQISGGIAAASKIAASILYMTSGYTYLIPQAGSPFAMKYGGKELGDSTRSWADFFTTLATIAESVSTAAGLEASFQRREEEWNQQLKLASQELKQVEQQRLAAEIRQAIAEKDLEIHERSIEHADELYEFYKDKFTNLGLYNYLSTTLNRLYREAYNVAYDLATTAENAYDFERGDESSFIQADNWQFDMAGLLAGERLILQLQQLENAYIKNNTRLLEVTQSFSLLLMNPSALIDLKETGSCSFEIPEIMFDLFYPGQYERIIKSVRITIPCVTGPYTNIGATLELTESQIRKSKNGIIDIKPTPLGIKPWQFRIATSHAQNDGGLFELNFRDERYLPFEGAGAISSWQLELPSVIRPFDYDTISDIIIHISYTAKYDGNFKSKVESQIAEDLKGANALYRVFSLRYEFPKEFYQLLNSEGTSQSAEFEISRQHFPYLGNLNLMMCDPNLNPTSIFLKPVKDTISTSELDLEINGAEIERTAWKPYATSDSKTNLMYTDVKLIGDPRKKWKIASQSGGLNKDELDDILILVRYRLSED